MSASLLLSLVLPPPARLSVLSLAQQGTPLLFFLVSLCLQSAKAHPQCRDFLPPFPVVNGGVESACSAGRIPAEDNGLTCCTRNQQTNLVNAAGLGEQLPEVCVSLLQEAACAACHPYAEHIFGTPSGQLPGLCDAFCGDLTEACAGHTVTVAETTMTVPSNADGAQAQAIFCQQFKAEDQGYCVPTLQALDEIVQDDSDEDPSGNDHGGERPCICMQPVADGWQNALAVVAPPDGTDRLFVVEQTGRVWTLQLPDAGDARELFMDISEEVFLRQAGAGDERGLWWITFHPQVSRRRPAEAGRCVRQRIPRPRRFD